MAQVLIVHHSPTKGVQALTEQIVAGANDDSIEGVDVLVQPALEATSEAVLASDGFIFGTPANFGYMSGALKHFFDSNFLAIGGALGDDGSASEAPAGRQPFGLYVHGRYDTTGAVRSVNSIVQALGWKQSAQTLEVLGDVDDTHLEAAYELGGTISALVGEG